MVRRSSEYCSIINEQVHELFELGRHAVRVGFEDKTKG